MTKKEKTNYNELPVEEAITLAVKECFKDCKGVKDVKVIRNTLDLLQIKVINDDMQDMLFDVTAWTSKNEHEPYQRYFIAKAYRLSVDKIQVKHDLYTFERIDGSMGYYLLEFKKYVENEFENPYTFKKLEYEYIFREHEVQGV